MPRAGSTPRSRQAIERAVLRHAQERPEWGQARVAAALAQGGLRVSPAGVRWILQRHGLETAAKRAAALRKPGAPRLGALLKAALSRISARSGGARSRRSPLTREHLLAVAAREFNRRGFSRTSIRSIARAAGTQPGTLYYHFPSKDELFIAAHAAGMREVTRVIEAAIVRSRDPWEQLEIAATVHVRHLISGNDLTIWTGASLFLFDSPEMQRLLRVERDRFESVYRRLIAALPLPPGIDRSLLRLQLLGALNWTRIWYRPGRRGAAEIAGHLIRALKQALADQR